MRILHLTPLLLAAACAHPPMPPAAPVNLTVPITPTQVVQRAAQRLVVEGFTIITSDATAGVLTATLTRQGTGSWGPYIACNFGDESRSGAAVLTVRLTAQAGSAGSAVYLATNTSHVEDAGESSSKSETDCASSGVVEKHIVEALTAQS